MTTFTKVALISTSVGTIGGGLGLGIHLLSSSTIRDQLSSEGFELELSDENWRTVLTAHNLLQAPKAFVVVEGIQKNEISWLKNKCSEVLNKDLKDSTNYKLARQWCVKEETISAILSKKNSKFRILNTKTTINDNDIWNNKIRDISSNTDAKNNLGVTLSGDASAKITEIKGKCKEAIAKKTTDSDFNDKFELVKLWCSV